MSRNQGLILIVATAIGWAAISQLQAADPPTAAEAAKQITLDIKLPKELFIGTPENLKGLKNLEIQKNPRPPFVVPAGTTNLALKKKVTSSDMEPIIGDLGDITNGDKDGNNFVELGAGRQWVQIDLGKPADIYAVVVWHSFQKARVYHGVVVQISDDPDFIKDVKTIFNNDIDNSHRLGAGKDQKYIDNNRGKLIDAKDDKGQPVKGRYIRLHSNGNTENDMNHYVEVEVYGKTAK